MGTKDEAKDEAEKILLDNFDLKDMDTYKVDSLIEMLANLIYASEIDLTFYVEDGMLIVLDEDDEEDYLLRDVEWN